VIRLDESVHTQLLQATSSSMSNTHVSNLYEHLMMLFLRRSATGCYVVRASAQCYLRTVAAPMPYQQFFRAREQVIFLEDLSLE